MFEKSSLKKNMALQTLYEVIGTCIPLVTSPYLSRVLGPSQLGIFSFTSSVVAYFLLFSKLGNANLGVRSIASLGDDKQGRSTSFWGLFSFQAITTTLCLALYIVYLLFICKDNHLIALIQIVELVTNLVCINWLFSGRERFELTVTVSIVIRLLSVAGILCFVKTEKDLPIYAIIITGGALLTQLVLWLFIRQEIDFVRIRKADVVSNVKPSIMLFIPLLAMSVYHVMDKTMLGAISSYDQSGFYYNADKIVNITVGVISGISTVMLPRMSLLISQNKKSESDDLFRISLEGTVIVGTAMAFGIAAIAYEFEPFFFGPGYEECINLTVVLAPVLLIKSFSFTARYQYLVPHKKEKEFIISVIAGAATNLALNLVLIPRLGAMGAVVGTLFAELVACVFQYVSISKYIKLNTTLLKLSIYVVFGIIMVFAVRIVAKANVNIVVKLILEVISGVIVYLSLCLLYWKITGNHIAKTIFHAVKKNK